MARQAAGLRGLCAFARVGRNSGSLAGFRRIGSALMTILVAVSAYAEPLYESWEPVLMEAEYPGYRDATAPLTLQLPELTMEVLGQLMLELDAIDITSQVQPSEDGRTATYIPGAPLEPGKHTLRLVQVTPDGEILERGVWEFEVRESRQVREGVFNYAVAAQGTARAVESSEIDAQIIDGEPSTYQYSGSTHFDAYVDSGIFETTGRADLIADGNYRQTGGERPFDMGEYLLTMESQNWHGNVGHHLPSATGQPMQSNLILDGYPRRGISTGIRSDNQRAALSNYAVRTEQINGFRGGLGIGNPEHRLHGVNTRLVPVLTPGTEISIGSSYLRGDGEQAGYGIGGNDIQESGEAANIVLDSYFWRRQINLRGEYAKARFKAGNNLDEDSDDAYSLYLGFQPQESPLIFEQPLYYSIGLDHARFGSFYRSIGNLHTLRDIEETRLEWTAQYRSISLNVNAGTAEDNVDDDPAFPTTRLRTFNSDLSWSPQSTFWPGWLATPSFGVSTYIEKRETIDSAAITTSLSFPSDDLELLTRGGSIWAQFTHPFGHWGISYSPTEVLDFENNQPDLWHETSALFAGFTFWERWSINPSISYDKTWDRSNTEAIHTTAIALDTHLVLVRDWWDVGLNFSRQNSSSSDGQPDQIADYYGFRTTWYFPMLQLWIDGTRSKFESGTGQDPFWGIPVAPSRESSYQIFTGIGISLPIQHGAWQ